MITKEKKRIEVIDLAKAFTIILVILGHTVGNLDEVPYRLVLYSFHMPLFFFLAGLSMKAVPVYGLCSWKKFLNKNILTLVVPYLIWGMLWSQSTYDKIPKLFYGSWESLVEMNTLSSLWFLSCFFVAKIYVQLIISLIGKISEKNMHILCGAAAIVMFTIGILLPHPKTGLPWCCDVAFVAAAFILAGVALRNSLIILSQQKIRWLFLIFAASVVILYLGTVFRLEDLGLTNMCYGDYRNIFWYVMNSASGSMTILSLSMIISLLSRESEHPFSTAVFDFIGKRTLGLFLIHKPILWTVLMPLLTKFFPNLGVFPTSVIATAIVLPISCGLCYVIEKYVPQLLGQFHKD